jgi:hypothetical protein
MTPIGMENSMPLGDSKYVCMAVGVKKAPASALLLRISLYSTHLVGCSLSWCCV